MRTPRPLVGLLLLLVAGAPAHGGEAPGPDRITDHLPAPKDAEPLRMGAYLIRGGRAVARMEASVSRDGEAGFTLKQVLRYTDEDAGYVEVNATTGPRFGVTHGSYARRNAAGFLEAKWHRGPSKDRLEERVTEGAPIHIAYRTQEYENEIEARLTAPAHTSLVGALFLARHAPRRKAAWTWSDFAPDPAGGDRYVEEARLECLGKVRWSVDAQVSDAWVFSYARGKRAYRFALQAETGRFLGLEVEGMDLELAPTETGAFGPLDEAAPGLMTPIERARRRALAIRQRMPARGPGWRYEGELLLGDYKIGRAVLAVEPTSVGGEPAWIVHEHTERVAGEARVVGALSAFLAPDLALLRGETLHHAPSGRSSSTFGREGSAVVTRHHVGAGTGAPIAHPVRPDATVGLAAVVSFLMHVPETRTTYVLSGFDPRYVTTPKAGSGSFPLDVADAFIEVEGPSAYSTGARLFPTLAASVSSKTGRRYTVHLDRETRALVAVVGGLPSTTIAPKGTPGKAPDFFQTDAEPRSAYEAFIRFGRGYHLPREDYLAKAFHWPRMLAHDIRAGTYPANTELEAYKRDWIQEFVKRSKHRTLGDCDDLLLQILMTSKETHGADGALTLATLPAYGGHVYRIEQVEGRWFLTAID